MHLYLSSSSNNNSSGPRVGVRGNWGKRKLGIGGKRRKGLEVRGGGIKNRVKLPTATLWKA